MNYCVFVCFKSDNIDLHQDSLLARWIFADLCASLLAISFSYSPIKDALRQIISIWTKTVCWHDGFLRTCMPVHWLALTHTRPLRMIMIKMFYKISKILKICWHDGFLQICMAVHCYSLPHTHSLRTPYVR